MLLLLIKHQTIRLLLLFGFVFPTENLIYRDYETVHQKLQIKLKVTILPLSNSHRLISLDAAWSTAQWIQKKHFQSFN